jgi:Fe-S-cluster-containing dehydrogenase component
MARYAMVIDTRRCIGCESCTVACRTHNDLPIDMIYNPVMTIGPTGVFPNVHLSHLPLLCMHCSEPPCVDCCPTGASQQREDGIVFVEQSKCIGCKTCIMSCPYGARHANHETGTAVKCDFCKDRQAIGRQPFCVETCHQKARIFGDVDDPESEVYRLVHGEKIAQLHQELGTEPNVYYILS